MYFIHTHTGTKIINQQDKDHNVIAGFFSSFFLIVKIVFTYIHADFAPFINTSKLSQINFCWTDRRWKGENDRHHVSRGGIGSSIEQLFQSLQFFLEEFVQKSKKWNT